MHENETYAYVTKKKKIKIYPNNSRDVYIYWVSAYMG